MSEQINKQEQTVLDSEYIPAKKKEVQAEGIANYNETQVKQFKQETVDRLNVASEAFGLNKEAVEKIKRELGVEQQLAEVDKGAESAAIEDSVETLESAGEQFNSMIEKAKDALSTAIIEGIKNGSVKDPKSALEDLLVFDRITAAHVDQDNIDIYQKQIDDISSKYGIGESMFSMKKFVDLVERL